MTINPGGVASSVVCEHHKTITAGCVDLHASVKHIIGIEHKRASWCFYKDNVFFKFVFIFEIART